MKLMTTLYFDTGVELEWPTPHLNVFCETGAEECSMWDLVIYNWYRNSAQRRAILASRGPLHRFEATVAGTRALIAHLQPTDDWMFLMAAIVQHQMTYQRPLSAQFDWGDLV
jgi:hypothetical protein